MAFDAGMMAFSVKEMSASLVGGKVEKIYQPSRDEIIILVKNGPTRRLKISAGASPMIGMTEKKTENPVSPFRNIPCGECDRKKHDIEAARDEKNARALNTSGTPRNKIKYTKKSRLRRAIHY